MSSIDMTRCSGPEVAETQRLLSHGGAPEPGWRERVVEIAGAARARVEATAGEVDR